MSGATVVRECETFSFGVRERVGVFTFRGRTLFNAEGLSDMETLAQTFRECSADDAIKVLMIRRAPEQKAAQDYAEFVKVVSEAEKLRMHRMLNFFSRLILEVYAQKRFVLSVDRGTVVAQFFNLSLACDYRLVADDLQVQKGYLRNGVVPKGGATWFLSQLVGRPRAYQILLDERDLGAREALSLGLVDEVVPVADLEEAAFRRAEAFAALPEGTLYGVKALMNHRVEELEQYMAFENDVIARVYTRRTPTV